MIQFIPEWTDDEVLEYVGRVISDYMASLSSGEDFDRDVCVGLQALIQTEGPSTRNRFSIGIIQLSISVYIAFV